MPSKSPEQHRMMEAVAHDSEFANKVHIPQSVGQDFASADKAQGHSYTPDERKAVLSHMGTMSDHHLHIAHHAAVTAKHADLGDNGSHTQVGQHTTGFQGSMAQGSPQNVAPNWNSTQPSPSPTPPTSPSHFNPADLHERLFGGGMSSMPTAKPATKRAKASGPGAPAKPQSGGGYGY